MTDRGTEVVCRGCGKRVPPAIPFCPYCGARVEAPLGAPPAPPAVPGGAVVPRHRQRRWSAGAVPVRVLLVAMIVGGIALGGTVAYTTSRAHVAATATAQTADAVTAQTQATSQAYAVATSQGQAAQATAQMQATSQAQVVATGQGQATQTAIRMQATVSTQSTAAALKAQEDQLQSLYDRAQASLRNQQWTQAYDTLTQIQQLRRGYRDVDDIVYHLTHDAANPVRIDVFAALNPGNNYRQAPITVLNLIGQPIAAMCVVNGGSYFNENRNDLIFEVDLTVGAGCGRNTFTGAPKLVTVDEQRLRDKATEIGQTYFVANQSGQVFNVPDFGPYHGTLRILNVAQDPSPRVSNNQTGTEPVFTQLILEVTLI